MGSSVDNRILRALVKFREVSHVACHTNHQTLIMFRILLGGFQRLVIYHVNLNVIAAVVK